nr:hypothetical protein BaRGS_009407 [Batillaria attramentaria]
MELMVDKGRDICQGTVGNNNNDVYYITDNIDGNWYHIIDRWRIHGHVHVLSVVDDHLIHTSDNDDSVHHGRCSDFVDCRWNDAHNDVLNHINHRYNSYNRQSRSYYISGAGNNHHKHFTNNNDYNSSDNINNYTTANNNDNRHTNIDNTISNIVPCPRIKHNKHYTNNDDNISSVNVNNYTIANNDNFSDHINTRAYLVPSSWNIHHKLPHIHHHQSCINHINDSCNDNVYHTRIY